MTPLERYRQKIAAGLCGRCGKCPAVSGQTRCAGCAAKNAATTKRYNRDRPGPRGPDCLPSRIGYGWPTYEPDVL